eukprot:4667884-Amphidinium_carterae.1
MLDVKLVLSFAPRWNCTVQRAHLIAIEEIPEQIGDALQKSAGDIVVEVMGQVHEVTDMIRSNGSAEVR